MSEEILKALTQLFAIITRQDGGVSEKERAFVMDYYKSELDQDSVEEYLSIYDKLVGYSEQDNQDDGPAVLTSTTVQDSVKTLAICKKINRTLTQQQKVLVLIKLLELVAIEKEVSEQRKHIIETIAIIFNITENEINLVRHFVSNTIHEGIASEHQLLILNGKTSNENLKKGLDLHGSLSGKLSFLHLDKSGLYFAKYLGEEMVNLNGFNMKPDNVYLFSTGSTIKTPSGHAIYFSELVNHFNHPFRAAQLSFQAERIAYEFSNGHTGLRGINISEGTGQLIGIMGASGAGKTTLLNVLAGILKPSSGEVRINGYNIHTQKNKVSGVIGYVSQDDLLIEELTVYENLYYSAKLCFGDIGESELREKVTNQLESLGLENRKHLRVGSVLDHSISGGQRKRLNIALELIREPAILFVDEPTSGLSSRDSENVIDLLKELSLKGKLIITVIHQPSSDIFKMFDKMMVLDTGGYPVYYGNPIEAITYFKKASNQIDSDRGQCQRCGNVNPEQILNIVEAEVVDEFGAMTGKRKVQPQQWHQRFMDEVAAPAFDEIKTLPAKTLKIPSKLKQWFIFTTRDFKTKIKNNQYLVLNLLEAPLLALILSFIIRYKNTPLGDSYLYRHNDNIPAYLMMAIIVALFMGMTVSAEEIIRDRKILKRESFLNLSWNSYLMSKITVLFALSAIQTFCFVLIGNSILEIRDMLFPFWLILFTVSCFGNLIGLNISSAFNKAVTVYIAIPLLLIPQMILSGLLFPYDKINDLFAQKGKVPIIADMMASRWAFEGMAVYLYKENDMERPLFVPDRIRHQASYRSTYWIPALEEAMTELKPYLNDRESEVHVADAENAWALITNELTTEDVAGKEQIQDILALSLTDINFETLDRLSEYFEYLSLRFNKTYNEWTKKREFLIANLESSPDYAYNFAENRGHCYNERLEELVRNQSTNDRIVRVGNRLVQQIDPIFKDPDIPDHPLDYRTQFYAPEKIFAGYTFNTLV